MSATPEEPTLALEVVSDPEVRLGTIHANSPDALVAGASTAATALARVIKSQGLAVRIQGREHVKVEGWLTLATMMGCLPREVTCDREEDGSYVARVELVRMSDGEVLSMASAECGGPEESTWQNRAPYARRSMATTRATSKACRIAFSWVMALSGYDTTPAEEMEFAQQPASRQNVSHGAAPTGDGDRGASAARSSGGRRLTDKQIARLHAIANSAKQRTGCSDPTMRDSMQKWKDDLGIEHFHDLTKDAYDRLCGWYDTATGEQIESFIGVPPADDAQPTDEEVPF